MAGNMETPWPMTCIIVSTVLVYRTVYTYAANVSNSPTTLATGGHTIKMSIIANVRADRNIFLRLCWEQPLRQVQIQTFLTK